jgi:hypothetical protein
MVPSASEETTQVKTPWSWGGQLGSTVIDETNTTTLLLSPQINVAYRLAVAWNLLGTWSFSALVDSQGLGEASLRAGNPLFATGYGRTQLNRTWKATFGVTLPIVRIPSDSDGRLYTFLVNHNLAMNGMWNAWIWLRDFIALPVQGSLTFPLPYSIPMTLAGGIAPLIGVRKQKSDQDLMAQISVAVELSAFQRIHFSPRWQLVLLPSTSLDRLQSAAAIRASYIASQSRYFIEVLFNLDEPLGMLRGLERWGLWLGKEMDP